jgi:2'-5' RNA ligase
MDTLVLTLQLDPGAQAFFEERRRRYFPPALNRIPAHLTLLHQLPHSDSSMLALAELAEEQTRFPLQVMGLRSLGRGVAYELASPELLSLHAAICTAFAAELIPQDRQRFKPHVVVQNKATPDLARRLLMQLQQEPFPPAVEAHGLDVWLYLGGPWQHLRSFAFEAMNGTGSCVK